MATVNIAEFSRSKCSASVDGTVSILPSNASSNSFQSVVVAAVCSAVTALFTLICTAVFTALFTYICTKKHFTAKINRLEEDACMYYSPLYEQIDEGRNACTESEEMERNPAYGLANKWSKPVV